MEDEQVKRLYMYVIPGVVLFLLMIIVYLIFFNLSLEQISPVLNTYTSQGYSENELINNGSQVGLNAVPTSSLVVTAKNDSWLAFDGGNDSVRHEVGVMGYKYVSVSVWINWTGVPCTQTGDGFVVSKGQNGQFGLQDWYFSLACTGFDKKLFTLSITNLTSGADTATTANNVTNNTWSHVVFVTDGASAYLFLNATRDPNSLYLNHTAGLIDRSDAGITIGSKFDTTQNIPAWIDEVRIYNLTLNQSDVTTLYQAGRLVNKSIFLNTTKNSALLFYESFNENSGTTAFNRVNTFNNGSILNGTVWTNDSVTKTLVSSDYINTLDTFKLTNDYYSWTLLNVSYSNQNTSNSLAPLQDNFRTGGTRMVASMVIIFLILGACLVITLIIFMMRKFKDMYFY